MGTVETIKMSFRERARLKGIEAFADS